MNKKMIAALGLCLCSIASFAFADTGNWKYPPGKDVSSRFAGTVYRNDLIDLEEYKRDKESYLDQIAELEAADNTHETNAEAARQLLATDFEKSYTEWSDADKRRFWRGILKAIYFNKDRVIDPDFLL